MADSEISLTGLWHGQYSYPAPARDPVPFVATLLDAQDRLSGSITERASAGPTAGRRLFATVSGTRSGHGVSFVKRYEADCDPYQTVTYDGVVSEDGSEIEGRWTATGWQGKFLMIRSGGLAQHADKRVAEPV